MQFQIITTQAQLHDYIMTLDNSPVSLDTEFVRTRTYTANLGLLQVSQNEKIVLLDPLSIIKGIEVDKGESRTDWCARPLTDKQLSYASIDVLHLQPCLEYLQAQIEAKNMTQYFEQECQFILEQKMKKQNPDLAYKSLNNLFKLDRHGLAVIQALAKWRLLTAQKRNLALNFVVKADNLWLLAHYRPTSMDDLRRLNMHPNEIRLHGKAILAIINDVEQQDPEGYPQLTTRLVNFPAYKKTLKLLKEKIQACADKHDLPVELIASKRVINEYLSWLWKLDVHQKETAETPKLLTGWRFDIIGHQFEH